MTSCCPLPGGKGLYTHICIHIHTWHSLVFQHCNVCTQINVFICVYTCVCMYVSGVRGTWFTSQCIFSFITPQKKLLIFFIFYLTFEKMHSQKMHGLWWKHCVPSCENAWPLMKIMQKCMVSDDYITLCATTMCAILDVSFDCSQQKCC
jgi:hypothetical protein